MEGLFINAILRELTGKIPVQIAGWVFPDDSTAAVQLEGMGNLVLRYRPPSPILTLEKSKQSGEALTPFQRFLETKCRGKITRLEQVKLDRVVILEFSGEKGFVEIQPTRVVFELTGRNANLIVTDPKGIIVGLDRPVTSEINRFRELRTGLPYAPPPPYEKIDPRSFNLEELNVLTGKQVSSGIQKTVDGIGKELILEVVRRLGITPNKKVEVEDLPAIASALESVVANPGLKTDLSEDLRKEWAREQAESLRSPFREGLQKQIRTLQARLRDANEALEKLEQATKMRNWADLLMAFAQKEEPRVSLKLTDFEGNEIEIPLEVTLSPVQNATKFYQRAKRLESNAEKALELIPEIEQQITKLNQEINLLEGMSQSELFTKSQTMRERGPVVGIRLKSPSGFDVWIGKNNKENDLLTRSAHSEDLWFHAQGIPGSHVILRTQGRNAPLEDLLFAAALAAFNSKGKGDKNIAVDYTSKKHVWKPRKAAAGQVLYSQGKSLFVDATMPEN